MNPPHPFEGNPIPSSATGIGQPTKNAKVSDAVRWRALGDARAFPVARGESVTAFFDSIARQTPPPAYRVLGRALNTVAPRRRKFVKLVRGIRAVDQWVRRFRCRLAALACTVIAPKKDIRIKIQIDLKEKAR